jgi:hypothetical protein
MAFPLAGLEVFIAYVMKKKHQNRACQISLVQTIQATLLLG